MDNTGEQKTNKALIYQYVRQAEHLLYDGEYDEALDVINNAIDIKPESSSTAHAYCMRAKIFHAQGKPEDAEADIKKAIALNPNDKETNAFQTRMELDTLIAKKKLDAKDYDRLLELVKRKAHLVDVGDVFYEKGYYEDAEKCYTKAIEYAPVKRHYGGYRYMLKCNKRGIYIRRGLAYKKIGMLEKAQEDFKTAEAPEWFDTIIPSLRKRVFEAIEKGVDVSFSDPDPDDIFFTDGVVYFDHGPLAMQSYFAKTGRLFMMS
jgi:tetratricopeptide (TPR) repeat protein